MTGRNPSPIKVAYSVPELARMGGVSRKEMRSTLRALGIRVQGKGARSKAVVLLSDLQGTQMWDSILAKMGLDRALRDLTD